MTDYKKLLDSLKEVSLKESMAKSLVRAKNGDLAAYRVLGEMSSTIKDMNECLKAYDTASEYEDKPIMNTLFKIFQIQKACFNYHFTDLSEMLDEKGSVKGGDNNEQT